MEALADSADGMRLLSRVAHVLHKEPDTPAAHLEALLDRLARFLRQSEKKATSALNKVSAMCDKSNATSTSKVGEYQAQVDKAEAAMKTKHTALRAAEGRMRDLEGQDKGSSEALSKLEAQKTANEEAKGKGEDVHADALGFLETLETRLSRRQVYAGRGETAPLRAARKVVAEPDFSNDVSTFLSLAESGSEEAAPQSHVDKVYALLGKLRSALLKSKLGKAEEKESAQVSYEADKTEIEDRSAEVQAQQESVRTDMSMLQSDIHTLRADMDAAQSSLDDYRKLLEEEKKFRDDLTRECKGKVEAYESESKARKQQLRVLYHTRELVDGDMEGLRQFLSSAKVQEAIGEQSQVEQASADDEQQAAAATSRFRARRARLMKADDQSSLQPSGDDFVAKEEGGEDADAQAARQKAELLAKVNEALAMPGAEPREDLKVGEPDVGEGDVAKFAHSGTGVAVGGSADCDEKEDEGEKVEKGADGEEAVNAGDGGLLMPKNEDEEMEEELSEGDMEAKRMKEEMEAAQRRQQEEQKKRASQESVNKQKQEAVEEAEKEAKKELDADKAELDSEMEEERAAALETQKAEADAAESEKKAEDANRREQAAAAKVAELQAELKKGEAEQKGTESQAEHTALSKAEEKHNEEAEVSKLEVEAKELEHNKEESERVLEATRQSLKRAEGELRSAKSEASEGKARGEPEETQRAQAAAIDRAQQRVDELRGDLRDAREKAVMAATGMASVETSLEGEKSRLAALENAETESISAEQSAKEADAKAAEEMRKALEEAEKEREEDAEASAKAAAAKAEAESAKERVEQQENRVKEKIQKAEQKLVKAEAEHEAQKESMQMQSSPIPTQEPLLLQPCGLYDSCVECTADARCGFIPGKGDEKGHCVAGTASGPYFYDGDVTGWSYGLCPNTACEAYTDCSQCAKAPGCGFCGALMLCTAGTVEGPANAEACPVENLRTWVHTKRELGDKLCPLRQRVLTEGAQAQEYAVRRARHVAAELDEAEAALKSALDRVTDTQGSSEATGAMAALREATARVTPLRREKAQAVQQAQLAETGESRSYAFGYKSGISHGQRQEAERKGYLHGVLTGLAKVKDMRGPRGPRGPRGRDGPLGPEGPRGPTGVDGKAGADAESILAAYAKRKKIEAEEDVKTTALKQQQAEAASRKKQEEATKALDLKKRMQAERQEQEEREKAKVAKEENDKKETEEQEKNVARKKREMKEKIAAMRKEKLADLHEVEEKLRNVKKQAAETQWDPEDWEKEVKAVEESTKEKKRKAAAMRELHMKANNAYEEAKKEAEAAKQEMEGMGESDAEADLEAAATTLEDARKKKADAESALAELEDEERKHTTAAAELEGQVAELKQNVNTTDDAVERQGLLNQVQAKEGEAQETEDQAQAVAQKIEAAKKQVDIKKQAMSAAEAAKKEAAAAARKDRANRDKAQARIKSLRDEVDAKQKKLDEAQEKLDEAEEKLSVAKQYEKEVKANAEKAIAEGAAKAEALAEELKKKKEGLEQERDALREEVRNAGGEEADKLNARLAKEEKRLADAKRREEESNKKLKREMEESEKAEKKMARVGAAARAAAEEAKKQQERAERNREQEEERKAMLNMMGGTGATGSSGAVRGAEAAAAAVIRAATGAAAPSKLKPGATGAAEAAQNDPELFSFREADVELVDEDESAEGPALTQLATATEAQQLAQRLRARVSGLEAAAMQHAERARSAEHEAAQLQQTKRQAEHRVGGASQALHEAEAAAQTARQRLTRAQDAAYEASVEQRSATAEQARSVAQMQEDMASLEIQRAKDALDRKEAALESASQEHADAESALSALKARLVRLMEASRREQHLAERAGERAIHTRATAEQAEHESEVLSTHEQQEEKREQEALERAYALVSDGSASVDMGLRSLSFLSTKLAGGAATLEAWVRADSLPRERTAFLSLGEQLFIGLNANTFEVAAADQTVEGPLPKAPVGDFVHLAATVSEDQLMLSINGVAINWVGLDQPLRVASSGRMQLMRVGDGEVAKGAVGPVAVWSRVLSQQELRDHARSRAAMASALQRGAHNGLVAGYTLQAGGALRGRIADVSPSGLDGRIVGRVSWEA